MEEVLPKIMQYIKSLTGGRLHRQIGSGRRTRDEQAQLYGASNALAPSVNTWRTRMSGPASLFASITPKAGAAKFFQKTDAFPLLLNIRPRADSPFTKALWVERVLNDDFKISIC